MILRTVISLYFLSSSAIASLDGERIFKSQVSTYTQKACGSIQNLIQQIAGVAEVSIFGKCRKGDYGYQLEVSTTHNPSRDILKKGSISPYTAVCVGQSGFPYLNEATAFLGFLGANIKESSVEYEVGGPALCPPGQFNRINLSWSGGSRNGIQDEPSVLCQQTIWLKIFGFKVNGTYPISGEGSSRSRALKNLAKERASTIEMCMKKANGLAETCEESEVKCFSDEEEK